MAATAAPAPVTSPWKRRRTEDAISEMEIDDVLDRLLSVRKRHPSGQIVHLPVDTMNNLCDQALNIFMNQPMLIDLEAPVKLCGDIHGQYHDLLRIFTHVGFPPESNYLFLGDYVDRGKKSLETICLLLAYKIKYPENFFLLRGNHETTSINRIYGFYDECKCRYSVKTWKTFCDVFDWLPCCAIIEERVICMHGGLSAEMMGAYDVREKIVSMQRPADIPEQGLLCDLLWSDPGEAMGFHHNSSRGVSVCFGPDVVDAFLRQENLDLVVRAHQVMEDGYQFFAEQRLVTVFSAPNYCGEFDNAAAILSMDANLCCSFTVLRPELNEH